jgi:hypothetical protein
MQIRRAQWAVDRTNFIVTPCALNQATYTCCCLPMAMEQLGVDPILRQFSARNKLVSAGSRRCWL